VEVGLWRSGSGVCMNKGGGSTVGRSLARALLIQCSDIDGEEIGEETFGSGYSWVCGRGPKDGECI
jgi:hypothetical protein